MQTLGKFPSEDHRGDRFVFSLLWNWMGVAAGLFTGLLLSPYLIAKLGPEAYGLWTLSFAIVEYCSFLDLGFRSAIVKYVAHHSALNEAFCVNQVINTGLVYSGLISTGIFGAALLFSGNLQHFFKVSASFEQSFHVLIVLVSLSWCVGFVLGLFGACLEAIQRFDLYNKVTAVTTIIRAVGIAVLLYLGHGLIAIGVLVVCTQCLGYILYFLLFRRTVPSFRLSASYASIATLRRMAKFGMHTFLINVSYVFLNQSPPVLIGHFLPTAYLGYFQYPTKLLQYSGDAVARIGIITNSYAAEFQARGDSRALSELAIYANRYSLAIFMPLAIALWFFGDPLFRLWVPSIAQYSAPLLPILLAGYMASVVPQFSSGMLLQGLGRHQRFARGLLAEAVVVVILLMLLIPRFGIISAAWVTAICMVLNRGVFAAWLVSREMGFSFLQVIHSIYTWPVIAALPVATGAYLLRISFLPGRTWPQLFAAGIIIAMTYFGLAFYLCLPSSHRSRLTMLVIRKLRFRTLPGAPSL